MTISSTISLSRFAAVASLLVGVTYGQTLFAPSGTVGASGNGNVGIGTSSPGQKLTVQGIHGDTQLRLVSDHYQQGVDSGYTALLSLWASEPGWTWQGVGIGNNVTNSGGISRVTNTRGGSYLRFLNNQLFLNVIDNNGNDRNGISVDAQNAPGIGASGPLRIDLNGDVHVGGAFRVGELYFSALHTIGLAIGSERWIKLATIPNNHYVRFQIRSGSNNSEEIAEVKVLGTYHNHLTGISVDRQSYNEHIREVRVVGADGANRQVYIKIRASDYAPSVSWRAIDSRGALTIHNIEEVPPAGLSHIVSGGLISSTNANLVTTGNVGIGTIDPTHKLAVNGTIKAKEVIVETTGWSDYVFADDYTLAPLAEVEAHIKEHKHLPGIPSAVEVSEQGVSVGDMQAKLLAKIEELTLHQIAQEKRAVAQESEIAVLRAKITRLEAVAAP